MMPLAKGEAAEVSYLAKGGCPVTSLSPPHLQIRKRRKPTFLEIQSSLLWRPETQIHSRLVVWYLEIPDEENANYFLQEVIFSADRPGCPQIKSMEM